MHFRDGDFPLTGSSGGPFAGEIPHDPTLQLAAKLLSNCPILLLPSKSDSRFKFRKQSMYNITANNVTGSSKRSFPGLAAGAAAVACLSGICSQRGFLSPNSSSRPRTFFCKRMKSSILCPLLILLSVYRIFCLPTVNSFLVNTFRIIPLISRVRTIGVVDADAIVCCLQQPESSSEPVCLLS